LVTFPLLSADEVRTTRSLLEAAAWVDGRTTAGSQAAQVKRNEQLPPQSEASQKAEAIVTRALEKSPRFLQAALPRRLFPPRFNRYTPQADRYGEHVDNAIRTLPGGGRVRTDLSCTVFLCEPSEYEGGELVVHGLDGQRSVKLPAGHAVLYPGHTVHEVRPVTRGARLASFFWIESMVRSHEQRRILLELDQALMALRQAGGDDPVTVSLVGTYNNLLRMWTET
jgi:PKHD-type hydroxylase